jgi:hypothetical protein
MSFSQEWKESKKGEPNNTFSGTRYRKKGNQESCMAKIKSDARFPCTHKKEPVDFHRLNILPSKNH